MQIGDYKVQLLLSDNARQVMYLVSSIARDCRDIIWQIRRRPNLWSMGCARHYEVGLIDLRVEHPNWDEDCDGIPF